MYKERVNNLLLAISKQNGTIEDQNVLFSFVEDGMHHFVNYVNRVCAMDASLQVLKFTAQDTEEYQYKMQNLDSLRTSAHDAAISAINSIDRLCMKLGVTPIYGGSQDRVCIGDFCGEFVNEYFNNRSGRIIERKEVTRVFEESMHLNEDVEKEVGFEIE